MLEVVPLLATDSPGIRLAGNLDVRNASNLQNVLSDLLAQGKPNEIDCSQIESVDCACVQLLLATVREAQGTIKLKYEPSSEVANWFNYAGVSDRLQAAATGNSSQAKGPSQ